MYRYVISDAPGTHEVYVDLINSPAGHYLSRQPYVLGLIKEVLDSVKLEDSKVTIERDMGRIIGNTDIIETTEKDTIYYAKPNKKIVFSKFAKNRFPTPSQKLTLHLQKDSDGHYEVLDAWIGPSTPPFPGDEKATAKSKPYWETHALVQDAEMVQSKTITKDCPY